MKILSIVKWGDIEDPSDYGVCSSCNFELWACSCSGGI